MEKSNIIGTGLSGLVGSRVVSLLSSSYTFTNISRETGTDITNSKQVLDIINTSPGDTVLHFAAKTDVDGCEKDRAAGDEGEAWGINVTGTKHVIDACEKTGKKLIYISTDMVFSGDNTPSAGYTEEDMPNPINWYATTKYEAEKLVQQARIPWIIMRTAYPYRATFEKTDFIRTLLSLLQQGKHIKTVVDHIFCPTFIDDIASAMQTLLQAQATGIFHVVGSQAISPYEAALLIARQWDLNTLLIEETTRDAFFANRALRPFNLTMNNVKINKQGVVMKTLQQGLAAIQQQQL